MIVKVFSGAVIGLDAVPVEVETDVTPGIHVFNIVGLPDAAVKESRDRVLSAILNSGVLPPHRKNLRLLVNLAPAALKKEGPVYDLPIALSILKGMGVVDFESKEKIFFGELALDGSVRRVNGLFPLLEMCKAEGFKEIYIPKDNTKESAFLAKNLNIFEVKSLKEILDHFLGVKILSKIAHVDFGKNTEMRSGLIEIDSIKGQYFAKRALEIAAAGNHSILMIGPPGSGKTILAQALASFLPPFSYEEALEVSKIYSVAGLTNPKSPFLTSRPFRSVHHSVTVPAIVGGGRDPRPGEISLAHRGVLFLDEFPEFSREVVESLRQPLESGEIIVSREKMRLKFPSRFILVAAANPCACGYKDYPDPSKMCVCTPSQLGKYRRRFSGPIIDRIDLHINVPRLTYEEMVAKREVEGSGVAKGRILKARQIQAKRYKNKGFLTNSEISFKDVEKICVLAQQSQHYLKQVFDKLNLSGRAYHRILKVSRTIADLKQEEPISEEPISLESLQEAIRYRMPVEEN